MTIRTRLDAIERKTGGVKPITVFFRTFYEEADGTPADTCISATVATGPAAGVFVNRLGDETEERFTARVTAIANGTIPRPASEPRNTVWPRPAVTQKEE